MKISTKRYVISSEIKNSNGFKVRTAGINLADFNTNPLLLWMHKRPKGDSKDEVLPIGNIVELKIEYGKLTGKLAFDENDAFALSLFEKLENGTLRMVSAGLLPLTWGEDETGEIWLETSTLKEVSLVDIGSNSEAVAVTLYQEDKNQLITLSYDEILNINLKPKNDMKLIQLNAPEVLPLLKLADGATPVEVQAAIANLVTLAAKAETAEATIVTLTNERNDFETKLTAATKAQKDAEIIALVDGAIEARKIVAGQKDAFVKLANADFEGTKAVLDGMTGAKKVVDQLKDGEENAVDFAKLTWKELEASNQLITLKEKDLPLFKTKFKTEFGTEYKEK